MPGLADMHMHTRDNWDEWLSDWPVSPLILYLANGVTTIRCFGPEVILAMYFAGEIRSTVGNLSDQQFTRVVR